MINYGAEGLINDENEEIFSYETLSQGLIYFVVSFLSLSFLVSFSAVK